MKRNHILFFTLFFTLYSIAQDYIPMFEIGKVWNMHHYDSTFPDENYDFNITIDYTSTIDGLTYYHTTNGDLFREDISNKRIYKRTDNEDILILDFDLNLNDILESPLLLIDDSFSKNITTIDTNTFYGISNLKYYEIDCGEKIIEGIGVAATGLFDISRQCSLQDNFTGAYLINMNILTVNNYFIKNNIKVFYNSKTNKLQLTNCDELVTINLYSILGKKVISTDFKDNILLSHLKKGIYFYLLTKNNSSKKGKIITY